MQPILEKINLVWEMVAEIDEGKNEVKFILKNEFKKTSKILIKNKKIPT